MFAGVLAELEVSGKEWLLMVIMDGLLPACRFSLFWELVGTGSEALCLIVARVARATAIRR